MFNSRPDVNVQRLIFQFRAEDCYPSRVADVWGLMFEISRWRQGPANVNRIKHTLYVTSVG